MPVSDAQLVLLSAASQREDALLPRPGKLAGAVLARMEAALVRTGAAEPVPVRADQPTWHLDEAGTPIGLRITAAGLAGIGLEPPTGDASLPEAGPVPVQTPSPRPARAATSIRPGTKLARLVALLSTAEGTGIDALVAALSWQPHTIRAALTRLRQSGLPITTSRSEQNKTVYRIPIEAGCEGDAAVSASTDVA